MNQDLTDQQRKWLETYCDGTISGEEFGRFEKEMESSANFRALARSYLTMDANLSQGAENILDLSEIWAPAKSPKPNLRALSLWSFAALSIALFFAGLGLGGFLKPSSSPTVAALALNDEHSGVAILKRSVNDRWIGGQHPIENEVLSPGNYHLTEGSAEIEFYSGALLLLEAPVDLDLISSNEAFCRNGKLRALVPPQARGFTIQSPKFDLVDLGTEFGITVSQNGSSNVQVFDGEVELYPPGGTRDVSQLKKLTEGSGLAYSETGETLEFKSVTDQFLSFQDYHEKTRAAVRERFEIWEQWNQSIGSDDRALAHFDFQDAGSRLIDKSGRENNGAIIGAEWTRGRFPGKRALEFRRPGDRVRLEIPGEFSELTFSAWVRMDTITGRAQSLFLTDNYKVGCPHWQIAPGGNLRMGIRVPATEEQSPDHMNGTGYGSPEIFTPRRIGIWTFVCTTFSIENKTVIHYLNGSPVSTDEEFVEGFPVSGGPIKGKRGQRIKPDALPESLQIGLAEIGNWGAPFRPDEVQFAVRNFVGRIDSMTIWKVALSAEEVSDIYRQTRM